MTFRLPHLIAALLLHVVLFTLLVGGVQCSAKPQRAPVISAVLLDPSRQDLARQKKREQQRRDAQRKAELERQRREAEAKRQADQRKQQELEQQRKATAAAQKKKEDETRRLKQAADRKAAEQKKADEAARRKQEQDEKRERDAAAKREAAEQAELAEAMRTEETQRAVRREGDQLAATARERKLAEWADALVRHVQQNYKTPPGAGADFSCQVRMQLLPDGTVTKTEIIKSCGSAPLDRAVEDAVYRSSPMPRPADPEVFDRDLTINFTP